ncbi:cysteine hydrolase family protein [Tsukamurella sp. 1534]|uniref:cysteine hydrolase family protein n=1 Tax=Tsukamurella sp. 1534 TaxID=1151061 RepID=UPI00030B7CB9|nr:cysteine hydrolase [Tsukamurella sp. 1534]
MTAAVLALHWQVNVIDPGGFFGPMLAAPVAASGVVERATRFHAEAPVPVVFTRFTVPEGEGDLVRNTAFMTAVADAQVSFRPDADGARIIAPMREQPTVVLDNQRLSGLAGPAADWIAANGVTTVYITGVATNLTVEQTARHATDLGLTAHVVSDCVAAADETVHAASLRNLDLATAGCLAAADALASLRL